MNRMGRCGLVPCDGPEGFCEDGNETSDTLKMSGIFNQLLKNF